MDKTLKKCVFCGRQNRKTREYNTANGAHLRYILDDADGTYHCNECDEQIRFVLQNYDYYQFYGRQHIPSAWVKETEAFEKSLELDWTEEDILKIAYEEEILE